MRGAVRGAASPAARAPAPRRLSVAYPALHRSVHRPRGAKSESKRPFASYLILLLQGKAGMGVCRRPASPPAPGARARPPPSWIEAYPAPQAIPARRPSAIKRSVAL